MSVSNTLFMAFPYLAGKMLDAAAGQLRDFPLASIAEIGLAMVAVFLIQSAFTFLNVTLLAQVSERGMADLRQEVFAKLLSLDLTFYDRRRTGELISRITADAGTLYDLFSTTLAEFIRQVLILAAGMAALLVLSPQLTVFMLATFPLLVLLAILFGRLIRTKSKETQDKLAETNVVVAETLQAIQTVKAFTGEFWEQARYQKSMADQVRLALKTALYRGGFIGLSFILLFSGIIAVIWYGASLVQNGTMTSGGLIAFVLYTGFIGGSMAGFSSLYTQLQRAAGSSERVLDILEEEGEPILDGPRTAALSFRGHIQYDEVHFTYPTRPEVPVLKGVSLEVRPGEKAALVGPSGAGKSTVVQLLMRFYPVGQGQIAVDGQDSAGYDLRRFREQIGIVPQEVLLFGVSIGENIAYGRPGASQADIEEAASRAYALRFIQAFPEGMDTLVGERGVKLSGGQRQRVAIARAVLKDPAILILDEATSSLDAESEALVQQALDELMRDRTTLIIAHRLVTVRKADRIYVLDQGAVIESGTHRDLLRRDEGTYANLVKRQLVS